MLFVAIVEDSAKDTQDLKECLERYRKETGTRMEVNVFDRAETFLQNYKHEYDVVFMDIMLPYMNGMEAAEQLRKIDEEVPLIFVTDIAQYAIRGYRVGASDYFIKPITYYDFKLRMDKLRLSRKVLASSVVIHIPGDGDKIMSSNEVFYIEIMDKQLTYHTANGDYEARGMPLKKLEKSLYDAGFCRCSSSYLVNLRWCEELSADTVTVAGKKLRISRSMKNKFVSRIAERFAQ